MVSQKTVLLSLLYIAALVFISIWFMTRNFPEKQCVCKPCVQFFEDTVNSKRSQHNEEADKLRTNFAHENREKTKRNIDNKDTEIFKNTIPSSSSIHSTIEEAVEKKRKSDAIVHKLGIIVPFRNRLEELLEFVPYMTKFLNNKNVLFHIYVINQVDTFRFNRAALLNAGYLIAQNESCDYIAMHDVDLLPLNNDLNYGYPSDGPYHVSAPFLHPRYHYATFIGGIMLMTSEQFEKVNGLSTLFWGWGREDDELYMRIKEANLSIKQPVGITTGYQTFRHNHSKQRKRDYAITHEQRKASFKRDRKTGLNTMDHKILNRYELTITGNHVSMIAIELKCHKEITPWCE